MTTPEITIRIGNVEWQTWSNLSVSRSLNSVASAFSASGKPWDSEINLWSPVVIKYGKQLVFTGILDQLDASTNPQDPYEFGLMGRSKTSLLCDCSALPKTYTYMMPDQIIRDIASQFFVSAKIEKPTLKILRNHSIEWGTTAFEAIDQLGSDFGFLATDDESGDLILTTADMAGNVGKLDKSNVSSIRASIDGGQRFYKYVGQVAIEDSTGKTTFETATSYDDYADPNRVQYLSPSGVYDASQLKAHLDWVASTNLAQSIQLSIEVEGWLNPSGKLWSPNQLVSIVYPALGINDKYLIHSVNYNFDEVPTCSLSLSPQAGFILQEPRKQPAKKKQASKTSLKPNTKEWMELK